MKLRKDTKVELLRAVPLFSECTKRELEAIASEATELAVSAGRDLATEGASGREFVIIVEGAAEVRKGGRRINQLGSGDFLGEIALLTGERRTATVTTTAATDLLVLTDRAFNRITKAMPSVHAKVSRALALRLVRDAI